MKLTDYGFQAVSPDGKGRHLSAGIPSTETIPYSFELTYNGDVFCFVQENSDSVLITISVAVSANNPYQPELTFTRRVNGFVEKNRMYHQVGRDKLILNRILTMLKKEAPKSAIVKELQSFIEQYFEMLEKRKEEDV